MGDRRVPRTWFITGASRGLGRAFTDAVLAAGHTVVATARQPEGLRADLASFGERAVVLYLDVRDRSAAFAAVAAAIDAVGPLDVVVNNAGYGVTGAVEEITEAQARDQFETNFFGALWVTQAALPHMRERRTGHILQISSLAGLVTVPNLGMYSASKWALEAASEALASEVSSFGVKVILIEPGGFRTGWRASGTKATPSPVYDDTVVAQFRRSHAAVDEGQEPGDPVKAARVLLDLVELEAPPLRVLLGNMAFDMAMRFYDERLAEWWAWEDTTRSVDFEPVSCDRP